MKYKIKIQNSGENIFNSYESNSIVTIADNTTNEWNYELMNSHSKQYNIMDNIIYPNNNDFIVGNTINKHIQHHRQPLVHYDFNKTGIYELIVYGLSTDIYIDRFILFKSNMYQLFLFHLSYHNHVLQHCNIYFRDYYIFSACLDILED